MERMNWSSLMTSARFGTSAPNLQAKARSDFERDADRIVFSSAFRRLQNKTQVFPIPKSDFVHTRLTHSFEVASVGRSLGRLVGDFILMNESGILDPQTGKPVTSSDFADVVYAACLAHDIGNPPFGHSGENAFRDFFEKCELQIFAGLTERQKADLLTFEGNAEGFRILTNDHPSQNTGGLKLTYATLGAFCKYTKGSCKIKPNELGSKVAKRVSEKKTGFFKSEENCFLDMANTLGLLNLTDSAPFHFSRHPLSFVMEAADNICYQIIDLEDAHKLGLIGLEEVIALLKPFATSIPGDPCDIKEILGIKNSDEKIGALRAKAISSLTFKCLDVFKDKYKDIMLGCFDDELTDYIDLKDQFAMIKESKGEIFGNAKIVALEYAGRSAIHGLLDIYLDALEKWADDKKYAKSLIKTLPEQYQPITSQNYLNILKIVTFISRMTDSFAIDQYRMLSGHKLPEIG